MKMVVVHVRRVLYKVRSWNISRRDASVRRDNYLVDYAGGGPELQELLLEAQRFPDDSDGIVAGHRSTTSSAALSPPHGSRSG